MNEAYVGLGANVGDPESSFHRALRDLEAPGDAMVLAVSALYRSAAVGPGVQEDYRNAVARIATSLAPLELLKRLKELEARAGREPGGVRWGPRPLDLDLLTHDDHVLDGDTLVLPHPRVGERNFVLLPLADVAGGDFIIPGRGTVAELLRHCPDNRISRDADPAWYRGSKANATPA